MSLQEQRQPLETKFPLSALEKGFWILMMGSALVIGVNFRFLGFSVWPLATDEFYIYRSMSFVLNSGLPEFPCGGYYTRGLLYQYVTVPLLAFGISPEASVRSVTILSSLAMLPAAYLLARRIGGFRIAAVLVTMLALSTWEIEMARFGRMYAPFQALFMWYVYHAYCLIETGDQRRWWWLLGLSLAGPLVWEGGITLALLNFLPIIMRQNLWRVVHLLAGLVVVGASLIFLQIDFRTLGPASAKPPATADLSSSGAAALQDKFGFLGPELVDYPALGFVFLLLAVILIAGLIRVLPSYRSEPRAVVTLLALTVSILANQILLAILILIGASLVSWFRVQDILSPRYRNVFLPLIGMSVVWVVVAVRVHSAISPLSGLKDLIVSVLPLFSFPELINAFLYPWLRSLPLMTGILVVGTGVALAYSLFRRKSANPGLHLLLATAIVCFTVIGAASIPYMETRYAFHVYPLLMLLSLYGLSHSTIGSVRTKKSIGQWAPPAFLCLFFVSSDFDFDHMVAIDTYHANFRVEYDLVRARQYYQRFDVESPANFVNQHADASDLVVSTSVVVTQYLQRNGYVYLSKTDERYPIQACNFGNTERWTGLPLLDDVEDIRVLAESKPGSRLWLITAPQAMKSTLPHEYLTGEAGYEQVFVSPDQKFKVYLGSTR